MTSHLYATGLLIGKPAEMMFEPAMPFVCCVICGEVFQSNLDRYPQNPQETVDAALRRREWARKHARIHPNWQHERLVKSGRMCTPEAAQKLATYGVIPLSDMVLDPEHEAALAEAPRLATDDAEGS